VHVITAQPDVDLIRCPETVDDVGDRVGGGSFEPDANKLALLLPSSAPKQLALEARDGHWRVSIG
jgi:hypothetical protein